MALGSDINFQKQINLKWQIRRFLFQLGLWNYFEYIRLSYFFNRTRISDSDFLLLKNFAKDQFFVLDIGANEGQSALAIRALMPLSKILSFEPNKEMETFLIKVRRRLGDQFDFLLIGCGKETQRIRIFTPYVDQVPLTQESTFYPDVFKNDVATRRRIHKLTGSSSVVLKDSEIEIRPLDSFFLAPDFIKIDVQGHELEVVEGGQQTIRTHQPMLMIENGPEMPKLVELLSGMDYKMFRYDPDENTLVEVQDFLEQRRSNLFFVHKSKIEQAKRRMPIRSFGDSKYGYTRA